MCVKNTWCAVALTAALSLVQTDLKRSGIYAAEAEAPANASIFAEKIAPIFKAHCVKCHGEKRRKADLDLSTPKGVQGGSESGAIIVPGKPQESLLYELVHSGEMPPGKKNQLSKDEVAAIHRWISNGAALDRTRGDTLPVTLSDVLPILWLRCTACHGQRHRESGLDLRSRDTMLAGGKSGPAIVLGRPEESLLIQRMRNGDMPPRRKIVEFCVKPPAESEIDLLAKWIALDAPEGDMDIDAPSQEPDSLVDGEDRNFWSFQPPQAQSVPRVKNIDRVRNPVDAFVLERLEGTGLSFAPEADRLTLLRRVSFDLTGLPPNPAEIDAILQSDNPNAYENWVDRLLASPRYGERWARHWLDVSGYADTEGKREQDLYRHAAYRYRDYLVRAFNADKPYDRFLTEQLAGDELYDYKGQDEISPEAYDALVATGFLRMGPDGTWAEITNFVPDRLEVVADAMDVLGSGVMALTVRCARCHSHKFDPIPQRDYYRLTDIFKGAFDEHDWMRPSDSREFGFFAKRFSPRSLPNVPTAERDAYQHEQKQFQQGIDAIKASIMEQENKVRTRHFESKLAELPESIREDVRKALAIGDGDRNTVQEYLVSKFEKQLSLPREELQKLDKEFKKFVDEQNAKLADKRKKRPPPPAIRALWDRGDPSPTFVLRRGDYRTPGRRVGPGVPSVLTDGKTRFVATPPFPGSEKTGRRLAFARWLTHPNQPLTARVIVNRVWKLHFGRGIVETLGNFGRNGARPTHPKLLDWLAREFVRQGWSFKQLHRLLLTSTTYRQSSLVDADTEKLDPDGRLYSRMPLRRMDAEEVRDSLLLIGGRLDERRFGPADPVKSRKDGLVMSEGTGRGWRRSIYIQQRRKEPLTLLESFDLPAMNPNCISRRNSNVSPQALFLMNNSRIIELAESFAQRVIRSVGDTPKDQVDAVYRSALSRPPTAVEKKMGIETLEELRHEWLTVVSSTGARADDTTETDDPLKPTERALADFCHTIVNSAAFLYID